MKTENIITSTAAVPTGRLTRARTAAFRANGQFPPLKGPVKPNLKHPTGKNNKKPTLDNVCLQRKRRAAFQDVTNIFCEPSYKTCFNATKIQAKKSKTVKERQVNISEVVPLAGEMSCFHTDAKPNMSEDILRKDLKLRGAVLCDNAQLRQNINDKRSANDNLSVCQNIGVTFGSTPLFEVGEVGCSGVVSASKNPDIIDIDADQDDPQLCGNYAPDIYNHFRATELSRRPNSHFIETIQRDFTQSMREMLVDWLVEVSEEYKLVPDTLYRTIYLIDWYLSQNYIERRRLQLLGITCLLISSKYEEICAPRVEEFCFVTDNTYTKEEVLKMERDVLKYLGFQLFVPTAKTFLRRFLRAAQASYKAPCLELEYMANYLAELTLMDYAFLKFIPSIIAASAVFLARWTIDQSIPPWNSTLEHYAWYKASDLKVSVLALQELQLKANGCPLGAVRMKYSQEKFKCVATLTSSKLIDTLF